MKCKVPYTRATSYVGGQTTTKSRNKKQNTVRKTQRPAACDTTAEAHYINFSFTLILCLTPCYSTARVVLLPAECLALMWSVAFDAADVMLMGVKMPSPLLSRQSWLPKQANCHFPLERSFNFPPYFHSVEVARVGFGRRS